MNNTDEKPEVLTELNFEELLRIGKESKTQAEDYEKEFNIFRKEFYELLNELFEDREKSYNKKAGGPTKEYGYGLLSVISLIYGKASRLIETTWPTAGVILSKDDVKRLLGTFEDIGAFASFGYAMLKILIENKSMMKAYISDTPMREEIIHLKKEGE